MNSVSVIIPCYLIPEKDSELLRFTQECISSLLMYRDDPIELVIVDNASTVGVEYLKEVADVYVANSVNMGFGPAVNQGIQAASGEWLVVCNNDIVFLDDWITEVQGAWREDTGCLSSHLIDHSPNRSVGYEEVGKQVGIMFGALWMTKREVVDRVGLMDEEYLFGMYEDKDWFCRVLEAGLKLGKVGYVRHIGNATWGKLPYQQEIYIRNRERFRERWGFI